MKLSIIIPTYNERENIEKIILKIEDEFFRHQIDGEIVIVDDNSPDGTQPIVERLRLKFNNIKLICRQDKLGLSSAVLEGFRKACGDIYGVMDADLSHPTEKINELYEAIILGNDLAIGSRYIKGGKIVGWNFYRKILSWGATILARIFTKAKDPMSGFFMVKKEIINSAHLSSQGFKILLEIIIKTNPEKVSEIPITFVNREMGKSKANTKEIIFYLKNLISYLRYRKTTFEYIKFATVGLLGTIINLGLTFFLTEEFKIYYIISASMAFVIVVTFNFTLNKVWTFKEGLRSRVLSKYVKFVLISLLALSLNLSMLFLLTDYFKFHYLISQLMAIQIASFINFGGNKIWIFNGQK
jgi:dolichol-phosphate mannosyltransferase